VSTFAIRLARLQYLAHYFPNGHPVLDIEKQLVQMAGAELREYALKARLSGARPGTRSSMEEAIRSGARARLAALVRDEEARRSIVERVMEYDLEEVLSGID